MWIHTQTRLPVNIVCGLLDPESLGESFLTRVKDLRLPGYEGFDGQACYKIFGRNEHGLMFRLWIEKKSKLVRRLEAKSHGLGLPVWITLTCEPRINKQVSKKHLKFGAPE